MGGKVINESVTLRDHEARPNYGATEHDDNSVFIEDPYINSAGVDPSENEQKGSNWSAYINIVCLIAGSGTLGIPYAIQQGGWLSVIILILSAILSIYANIKLIECLYHNGTRRSSMSELAYYAFGKVGLYIISFFFNIVTLGCPVIYLILCGENFHSLLSMVGIDIGIKSWVYICAVVMSVPFILMKTMKEATWLSIFGALTTALVVLVVFFTSISEYPKNSQNQHDLLIIRDIPLALATFSFSYGGNTVYPHVEASMANPRDWPKILSLATLTITIMYLSIGIPAYLTYGRTTLSPIYLNLPSGFATNMSVIMITAHILLALPIYQTAFALEVENYIGINVQNLGKTREFIYRVAFRLATVLFTTYCAINLPFFSDVMALLGSMGNGVLLCITPIIFWIKLFGWNQLNGWKEKSLVIFTLVFSALGAVTGTLDALDALWKDIMREWP
ncbi:4361_t:CDS:2 [Acaulospora morrowiae]|uniref:4361_t:CDS:1 n=1 Tax=Acaulospora morrowiae TaxID=94023 RepID=A0A9N9FF25_9GLOM|nr:4361_t:CDS:2 [Acaulospora morrowiae]